MKKINILKPINSEKTVQLSEKLQTYVFKVDSAANKLEIKKDVEALYNVSVEDVRTMKTSAKNTSRYTKKGFITGRIGTFKKAFVKLKKGDTIDFFS